jgi:hypothetical protein
VEFEDDKPKSNMPGQSSKAQSGSKVAIVAILVSGAVGIASAAAGITAAVITTEASHRVQQLALENETLRFERANMRAAFERAGVALINAVRTAFDLTNYAGATRINTLFEWRQVARREAALTKAQHKVERGYASIVVLFGASAPVTRAYDRAMGEVQLLRLDVSHAIRERDPSWIPSGEGGVGIDKARIAYEEAAHKLAGALSSAEGSSPP